MFFLLLVCLNWLYVLWVDYQPDLIINAWSVLIPLSTYFYFTFTFIAVIGLYNRKKFGLILANGVILFGSLSAAISYTLIYRHHPLIELMFAPLLLINLCGILYIASLRDYFKSD